ncbi:unnamed protein product, partial [Ectocarpus sp. 12 AP-2014]
MGLICRRPSSSSNSGDILTRLSPESSGRSHWRRSSSGLVFTSRSTQLRGRRNYGGSGSVLFTSQSTQSPGRRHCGASNKGLVSTSLSPTSRGRHPCSASSSACASTKRSLMQFEFGDYFNK